MSDTKTLLSVEDLCVDFRAGEKVTHAVENVSFEIERGETLALVGESGSGKTVSALSILQLLPYPAASHPSGAIYFKGENLLALPPDGLRHVRGNQISMIFQEPMTSLNPLHTIEKQVGEVLLVHRHMGMSGQAARGRVLDLLTKVGIQDPEQRLGLYPHQLSGGQRQRDMISRKPRNEPDLLIADEPTTALDVTIQAQIPNCSCSSKPNSTWPCCSSHTISASCANGHDLVCVMHHGHDVERGKTKDIFEHPKDAYTQHLIASEPKGSPPPVASQAKTILKTDDSCVWFPIKRGFLRKTVGHIKAVDGIDVDGEGQTLGVVGESGSARRRSAKRSCVSSRAKAPSSISASASTASTAADASLAEEPPDRVSGSVASSARACRSTDHRGRPAHPESGNFPD